MWPEISAGFALTLLLQSVLLFLLWHRLREVQQAVGVLARNTQHAYTDVPTSMLVTVLGRLERHLGHLDHSPLPSPSGQSYQLAQKMAREGATVEQLIARCGLSPDEARLISQLHSGDH
jgi:hypothetical protein